MQVQLDNFILIKMKSLGQNSAQHQSKGEKGKILLPTVINTAPHKIPFGIIKGTAQGYDCLIINLCEIYIVTVY